VKKVLQAHIKESIPLFGQALHTPEEISRKKIKAVDAGTVITGRNEFLMKQENS